mgnify:CR=1 FL=1
MIKLVLRGDPTAQARMRHFMRGGKTMTYDPQSALKKELKDQVREQIEKLD